MSYGVRIPRRAGPSWRAALRGGEAGSPRCPEELAYVTAYVQATAIRKC